LLPMLQPGHQHCKNLAAPGGSLSPFHEAASRARKLKPLRLATDS
jgi:hypothetical protein